MAGFIGIRTIHSGDFNLVVAHEDLFKEILIKQSFQNERGQGIAIKHQEVRRPDFAGLRGLIADQLGKFAAQGGKSHFELVEQARMIFRLAKEVDQDYLTRRGAEEGVDPDLLIG